MTRTYILPLLAAAALAGCDTKGETIVVAPGGAEELETTEANQKANVQLPPSIVATRQYRCKDNSIVSVDWLSDGKQNSARVTPKDGSAVTLTQAEAGAAYAAQGVSLSGDPQAQSITYNGQSCKR